MYKLLTIYRSLLWVPFVERIGVKIYRWLYNPQTAGLYHFRDFSLYLNWQDYSDMWHIMHKNYQENISNFLRKNLTKSMTFIDVGANVGYFSVLAGKYAKKVVAIEPLKRNYEILFKNLQQVSGPVIPLNGAVGAEEVCYRPFNHGSASSVGDFGLRPVDFLISEKTNNIDLAEIVGIEDTPLVIKLDTQGGEWGMIKSISLNKVIMIISEVSDPHMTIPGFKPYEMLKNGSIRPAGSLRKKADYVFIKK